MQCRLTGRFLHFVGNYICQPAWNAAPKDGHFATHSSENVKSHVQRKATVWMNLRGPDYLLAELHNDLRSCCRHSVSMPRIAQTVSQHYAHFTDIYPVTIHSQLQQVRRFLKCTDNISWCLQSVIPLTSLALQTPPTNANNQQVIWPQTEVNFVR